MSGCITQITGDIIQDCLEKPIAGIEGKGVLINRADIDFASVVRNAEGTIITALPLLPGKTGYAIDNIKNLNYVGAELVVGDTDNSFKQSYSSRFPRVDEKGLQNINAMINGEFVFVQERKDKGSDLTTAFIVVGLDVGLKITEGKYTTNENKGAFTFVLANEDGFEEPVLFYFLNETDYATTKPRYDAKFATA